MCDLYLKCSIGDKPIEIVFSVPSSGSSLAANTSYRFFSHINTLRVIFIRENINIFLHFMSLLHTNKTQVIEIRPRVRQGPAYST